MKSNYRHTTLPNGLRVLTVPLKETKAVIVQIFIGAGSRFEAKNINGISHFLEHMFFKGGERYPDTRAVASALDGVGGKFNAYTCEESVSFWVKLPQDKVELAFDVLSDMLLNAKLDITEVDRERNVILEEYNRLEDDPASNIGDVFQTLMYGDQPIGRSVIGDVKVLKKLQDKDLVDYKQHLYIPTNVVISVAGGISHEKALKLVKQYFPYIKADHQVKKTVTKSPTCHNRLILKYKKTNQAHLMLGIPGVEGDSEDKYAMRLLAAILGGSMSSRLWLNLRERFSLGYAVQTYANFFVDDGYLVTYAGVDLKRIDLAIKLILEEYAEMAKTPVSMQELTKNQEMIKGQTLMAMENSAFWSDWTGEQELLYNKIKTPEEEIAKFMAVTPKDIQKLAARLFKTEKMHLAVIGPYRNQTDFAKLMK